MNKGNAMEVYAVISGADYEGESFDSMRLFDCFSSAVEYGKELEKEFGVDYVLIEKRVICMKSAIAA